MGELLTPPHLMVIAVIALVLFGGKKLPELGKGLGEGLRGFKDGIKGLADELNSAEDNSRRLSQIDNNCAPVGHSGEATSNHP